MRIPWWDAFCWRRFSRHFLKEIPTTEPLILDPYAVVFVMMAHVRPEKILKVTGVIRGLHRKKS
jgi:hypothetical protein